MKVLTVSMSRIRTTQEKKNSYISYAMLVAAGTFILMNNKRQYGDTKLEFTLFCCMAGAIWPVSIPLMVMDCIIKKMVDK